MSQRLISIAVCVTAMLTASGVKPARAEDGRRSSYYKNGEIHVNVLGQPEGKPITSGHWDFKPSWSKTDDKLVFFRRLKDDPDVNKWITALCIINAKPFANAEGKKIWFDYPRFTKDGGAIVYHAGGKLFLYVLADGSTKQVSTDNKADYRYPHGEATPN